MACCDRKRAPNGRFIPFVDEPLNRCPRTKCKDNSEQAKWYRTKVNSLERALEQLKKQYASLQGDYKSMRNNHVAMTVINKRLQSDATDNEGRIARLTAAKEVTENSLKALEHSSVSLEEKTLMLAEKCDELEAKIKKAEDLGSIKLDALDHKANKLDLEGYQLSKDARIKAIKRAIDDVKWKLGPWGDYEWDNAKAEELLKPLYELV